MKTLITLLPLVMLTGLLGACTDQANAASARHRESHPMTIELAGVDHAGGGVIVVAIYDNQPAFDTHGHPLAWFTVPPVTKAIELRGLKTRPVAISAFHDANQNSSFDNKDGVPLEGWGSSGDIGKWTEPTYQDALVNTPTITVQMHYLD